VLRTCGKCGQRNVTTRGGVATCRDCQPRKNPRYNLRPHRRTVVQRGEEHGRALLTEASVRDIIERLANGATQTALATEFRVTNSTIGHIKHGRTWAHLQPVKS